ncbi:DUF1840 domain-containing protein [Hydrogenophilus thermoluteolus]|jgi:hypothetical protein|uniref:DUF1840 domain-containing protein n=1 Tax=Hydrogenophilus thermoluteolus TaxID=297 RepID=A0A2Z6DVJ1_HYDTE|nr:DUF1840 domain-containing protein [Hydrogenophilus thermoluteolus]MBW7657293.1 DUF1840 domain-containing protein [Hydrogenophilus thermoluteolus]BBD76435.1 hypothetical protein HPTL_0165 [Hydrogenophilus thermoluteolus]GLW61004.1 hypothetical protein Hthe01_13530 [Hydrogenophilus thermoluteolus]HNQ49742.1 DUF1840 domain-containing protein [Hydrogenophilus thermoluteolus]HNU20609.1 DUF1840 domain-containing protein [Hydrogenophilus thermoluteolus]
MQPEQLLITFRSDADADVIMYRKHAEPILKLLGKEPDRGILTPEQLPEAIAKLEAACAADRERERQQLAALEADADASGKPMPVGFHQRAWPLLQMMKHALAEHKPVVWGV